MARRRKKSGWQVVPLWTGALVLVGWGLWQAREFRRTLLDEVQQKRDLGLDDPSAGAPGVTSQPSLAIAGESVSRHPPGGDNHPQMISVRSNLPIPSALDTPDSLQSDLPNAPSDAAPRGAALPLAPVFDDSLTAEELTERGMRNLEEAHIVEGRAELNAALARTSDEALATRLRSALTDLNAPVFLGTAILPDDSLAHFVEVQSGDSFLRLGRQYGLTGDFVALLNASVNARNLKPLTGVKIVEGPFRIRLSKAAARIDLYALDMFVRSMPVEFPEGNYLPSGEYRVAAGTKLQLANRTWIGFEGAEPPTEGVTSGWIFGAAGPRGTSVQDRVAGIHVGETDLRELYNVLVESRSHLRVEP